MQISTVYFFDSDHQWLQLKSLDSPLAPRVSNFDFENGTNHALILRSTDRLHELKDPEFV